MNESAPPAPERSWMQLRLSTLLCLTAMVAAALGGVKLALKMIPISDAMWLWVDIALFVSGPVCAATLLWIGGRLAARLTAMGVLVFAIALSPIFISYHIQGGPPGPLLEAMLTFQFHQRFLTFCAVAGGLGAILERTSPIRVLLTLASSFMMGYSIGLSTDGF